MFQNEEIHAVAIDNGIKPLIGWIISNRYWSMKSIKSYSIVLKIQKEKSLKTTSCRYTQMFVKFRSIFDSDETCFTRCIVLTFSLKTKKISCLENTFSITESFNCCITGSGDNRKICFANYRSKCSLLLNMAAPRRILFFTLEKKYLYICGNKSQSFRLFVSLKLRRFWRIHLLILLEGFVSPRHYC